MNLEGWIFSDFWVLQNTKSWELLGVLPPGPPQGSALYPLGAFRAPKTPAEWAMTFGHARHNIIPTKGGYSFPNNVFGGSQNFPQYFQGVAVYITTPSLAFLVPLPGFKWMVTYKAYQNIKFLSMAWSIVDLRARFLLFGSKLLLNISFGFLQIMKRLQTLVSLVFVASSSQNLVSS